MSIATAPMPARRDQAGCAPCLPTRLVGRWAVGGAERHRTTPHDASPTRSREPEPFGSPRTARRRT